MDTDAVVLKLEKQENPRILFSDIDGTLFSPNLNLLTAPVFNVQTAAYLTQNFIPFIIVTGRSFWRRTDQYHLKLLGLPEPDVVITANGTLIFYKHRSGYISDFAWQGMMQSTKVTDSMNTMFTWNKWEITTAIVNFLKQSKYEHRLGKGNTYLIRLQFNKYPVEKIEKIRKEILQLFPKGLRVMLTEKLLWENSLTTFSGEMIIVPNTAGKDKAVAYLLRTFSSQIHKPIHGFIFGDATIDLPMLTMKEDPRFYKLSQFGIHPTPLARIVLEEKMKTNNHLSVLYDDGPKEILWTLRPELKKNVGVARLGVPQNLPAANKMSDANFGGEEGQDPERLRLSPAQNNNARKIIRVFEKVLDKIIDKNLSPNEISFLGLQQLSEGLKLLHKHGSFTDKTKGIYKYSFGNLTDILDGIRARNSNKKEENGQLVDGFSDRAKEFMQLFHRAKKRMSDKPLALETFLASISCALPSIARAQVEIGGKTVAERDEKGGSMIDRTRRLFLSLLFDTFNLDDYAMGKDREIFTTNVETFEHRLSFAKKFDATKIKIDDMSDFQKKALERFLLYVDVLQQENIIIKKYLAKDSVLVKQYEQQSQKLAKNYLEIPVAKLRKKFGIKDYKFEVKKYIR